MAKKYLVSLSVIFVLLISMVVLTRVIISNGEVSFTKAAGSVLGRVFPTPLTGTIIFVSNKSGNWEIYRKNLETEKEENLTNNPADDMNPQVSPDGKFIVFYSNRQNNTVFQNRNNQIYLMNLATRELTQLTTDDSGNYDPTFSPDGKKIAFKSTRYDGYGDIYIMNADGTDHVNLTQALKDTEEWDPVFDNTGQNIYFVSRLTKEHDSDEIFRMKSDGTNITRLTNNAYPDWYPAVNPATGQVAFISKKTKSASDDIFIINPDGSNRVDITNIRGNDNDPHWNNSGDKLIFINDNEGDYDMFLIDADGKGIRKIGDMPGNELSPIFLPESNL